MDFSQSFAVTGGQTFVFGGEGAAEDPGTPPEVSETTQGMLRNVGRLMRCLVFFAVLLA